MKLVKTSGDSALPLKKWNLWVLFW